MSVRRSSSPLPFMRFDVFPAAGAPPVASAQAVPSSTPHRARSSSSTSPKASDDLLLFGLSSPAQPDGGDLLGGAAVHPSGHDELVLSEDFFDVPSSSSSSPSAPSVLVPPPTGQPLLPLDMLFTPPPPASQAVDGAQPASTALVDVGDPFNLFETPAASGQTTSGRSQQAGGSRLIDVPSLGAEELDVSNARLDERISGAIDQVERLLVQAGDHASVRRTYQEEVRQLFGQIYKFYSEDRIEKGQCACERRLAYKYKFKIIQFDPLAADDTRAALSNLHTFTFGPSALSVAQQQFAELRMIRLILTEHVPQLQAIEQPSERLAGLLAVLERMLGLLANRQSLTAHSVSLIKTLVVYLADLAYSEPAFHRHLTGFFFEKLITYPFADHVDTDNNNNNNNEDEDAIAWLVPLFSPAPADVVELRLLELLVGLVTASSSSHGGLPVDTALLLLRQFPWTELREHAAELAPLLDLLLPHAAAQSHRLLAYVIKVQLQLGRPGALAQLLRSPWPVRIFTLPFLRYWPLHDSDTATLQALFFDLYHFFGGAASASLSELVDQQRQGALDGHRLDVVHFMLFNHGTTQSLYALEPQLADALAYAGYPLLHALTRVALLLGAEAVQFLAGELFYLAFEMPAAAEALPLPQPSVPGDVSALLLGLRLEARLHLQSLAQHSPQVAWNAVLPRVVLALQQQPASVAALVDLPQALAASLFRDHGVLAGWRPDSVDFLAALFGLPSVDTDTQPLRDKLAAFCTLPPQPVQHQQLLHHARLLGLDIFERVHWQLASAELQANAVVLLLALYAQLRALPPTPAGTALLSRALHCLLDSGNVASCSLLASLSATPFGALLLRDAATLPPAVRASLAVQVCRAVMLLSRIASTSTVASLGLDWLAQSGLVADLDAAAAAADPCKWAALAHVFAYAVTTIAATNYAVEPSCKLLSRFLEKLGALGGRGAHYTELVAALVRSIRAEPQSQPSTAAAAAAAAAAAPTTPGDASRLSAATVRVWATILFPHLDGLNPLLCGLWNDLAELTFLESDGDSGSAQDPLLRMFRMRPVQLDFVEALFSHGFHWAAHSALTAYGLANGKKALAEWRRLAVKLGTGAMALAFWRSFAALYYQLQEKQSEPLLADAVKTELTAHWRQCAEHYTELRDVSHPLATGPRELYFALTTWARPALEHQWFTPVFFAVFRKACAAAPDHIHQLFVASLPLTPLDRAHHHPALFEPAVYDDALLATADAAALAPPQPRPANVAESLRTLLERRPGSDDDDDNNNNNNDGSDSNTNNKLVGQLRKLFARFTVMQQRLQELDFDLVDVYQTLHENRLEDKTVQVRCARGHACLGPAQIQVTTARQLPPSPAASAAMNGNRETHAQLLASFQANLRRIGRLLFEVHVIAEQLGRLDTLKTVNYFLPSFDFFGTQLSTSSASEAEASAAEGVRLFLALAELCSDGALLPHGALLLADTVGELAAPLRNRLQPDSDVQSRLLDLIVRERGAAPLSADTYAPLLVAFAPGALLPQNRPMFTNVLAALCQYLERYDADDCPLPDRTLTDLLKCFDASDYFGQLQDFEIDVALRLLPALMLMEPLFDFTGKVACALLAAGRAVAVFRSFLATAGRVKYSLSLWENQLRGVCSRMDLQRSLDLEQVLAVLDSLCAAGAGPVQLDRPAAAVCLLTFVQRLCVPPSSLAVGDTGGVADFFALLASPLPNRGWECLHGLIRRATSTSAEVGALCEEGFCRLFDVLAELTALAPQLVDRMWLTACVLLERCVLLSAALSDRQATLARRCEALARFVAELPWERATFHRSAPRMLFVGTRFPPSLQRVGEAVKRTHADITSTVMRRLDWQGFVCPPDACVALLQWYLDWNVIEPAAIPPRLRDIVQPQPSVLVELEQQPVVDSSSSSSSDDVIDWRQVDAIDLATAINQSPLLRTLRDGRASGDPSRQLLDNATLLRDVAWASGNEMVVVACVREARSLMSVRLAPPGSVSSGGKTISRRNTWHLSSREQISLLTSVILPLSRFNVSVRTAGQLILSVLDILNAKYPKPEPVADAHSQLAGKSEAHPKFDPDFQLKVHGLILQSVQVATAPLCLEIMNTAALVMETPADQPPLLLFEVFEAALQSYLSRDDARLAVAVASLQLPALSWELCVQACHERRCSLCLLVMLEKHRRSIEACEPAAWLGNALALLETISYHTPPEITEFHLFPLWFFALRCVADARFRPLRGHADYGEPLSNHKSMQSFLLHLKTYADAISTLERLFSSRQQPIHISQPSVRMKLAARSVLLFVRRLLLAKGGSGGQALTAELDALMAERPALLAQHSPYAKTFFDEAETFLSPLCDLPTFERIIVTTLAPQAQHYLLRLISDAPDASSSSS